MSLVHKITKIVVNLTLVSGLVLLFAIPWLINLWAEKFNIGANEKIFTTIVIIISGILALIFVYQLRNILKEKNLAKVFEEGTIVRLRIMAICTFIIAIVYLIRLFFFFGLGNLFVVIAFFIGTLLLLTLKDLFKKALEYKQENDWTI